MGQQRNASNQSYGGGSSDYAVIAPYIESPSPFERMGGRQRASGGSSSGKNPFEDFKFDSSSIEGMYFQSGSDYLNSTASLNAQLQLLQMNAMSGFNKASAEDQPKVMASFLENFMSLNQQRNTVEALKTEEKKKYEHNVKLVEDYGSDPYYDANGRPVKDKDGNVLTYKDMHNVNSMAGLNGTFRLEAPITYEELYKIFDTNATSILGTMTDQEKVSYSMHETHGIKQTTIFKNFTQETQEEFNNAYQRIAQAINTNPDLKRAFNSFVIPEIEERLGKLSEQDRKINIEKIQTEETDKFVNDMLNQRLGSKNQSRVSKVTTQEIPRSEVHNVKTGTNPELFTDLQNVLVEHSAGNDPFPKLKAAIIGASSWDNTIGIPFQEPKTHYESGENTVNLVSVPSTKLETRDYEHLNNDIKNSSVRSPQLINKYMPPRINGMGMLLRVGNTFIMTDGTSIRDNVIGIESVGGHEIRWTAMPTNIGGSTENPDFAIYTTNPNVIRFNAALQKFNSLSEVERKKLYDDYYSGGTNSLTQGDFIPQGYQDIKYESVKDITLGASLDVISSITNKEVTAENLPEILEQYQYDVVGTSQETFTTDDGVTRWTSLALKYAKDNMNSPDIIESTKQKATGGFVPVSFIVNDNASITHGYNDENKYSVIETSAGTYYTSSGAKRRDSIFRKVKSGENEYTVIDTEVYMSLEDITRMFTNDHVKIAGETLKINNRIQTTANQVQEALKNSEIPNK